MKITEKYAKKTPQMVCGRFNIHKKIHSLLRKSKLSEDKLRIFLETQYSNIITNPGNVKNILNFGATDKQWTMGFRRLLNTYRINRNFVDIAHPDEDIDRRRWAIQGCGISIDFGNGKHHAVAGVISNGTHIVVDSTLDVVFVVDWENDKNWARKLLAAYGEHTLQTANSLVKMRNKANTENRKRRITLQIEEELSFIPVSAKKIANIFSVRAGRK
jgi:hypothetical protein